MKRYYTFTVKKLVNVQHLVTIEYLQMGADFSYPEEIHDFYEFVFVEKGKIFCKTDEGQVFPDLPKHRTLLLCTESNPLYRGDRLLQKQLRHYSHRKGRASSGG